MENVVLDNYSPINLYFKKINTNQIILNRDIFLFDQILI